MPPRKITVSETGLSAFQAWLNDYFPGRKLDVKYRKDGEEYVCSLKLGKIVIARGRGVTQKRASEVAAIEAHRRCNGEAETLRSILRSGESFETLGKAPVTESKVLSTPLDSEVDKKARKQISENRVRIEDAHKLILSQAREIKRLGGEVADLQKQQLAQGVDALGKVTLELRQDVNNLARQQQVPPPKSQDSGAHEKIRDLEETLNLLMSELQELRASARKVESTSQDSVVVTFDDWSKSISQWSPELSGLGSILLATALGSKWTLVPSLSVIRGIEVGLSPWARLSVIYVEPGWQSYKQLESLLNSLLDQGTDEPQKLQLIAFEGLCRTGLQTWARPLVHWAQGLINALPGRPGQHWPSNLRLFFVPCEELLPLQLSVPNLAAIPAAGAGRTSGSFQSMDAGQFLQSHWPSDLREPKATKLRLREGLNLLEEQAVADLWVDWLLDECPKTYWESAK